MKVYIFTEGGEKNGFGHISRCSALYEEILSRGIQVDFVVAGDVQKISFLDGIKIINDNWLDKEYLVNRISKNDYVIIDSYEANKEIYDLISNLSKKALYIDDTGRLQYPKGIIVNPSLDASSIDYSLSKDCILFSGPKYVILRFAFYGIKRKRHNKKIKRILITFGGAGNRKLMLQFVEYLCKKQSEIIFDLVVNSKDFKLFQTQTVSNSNIHIHSNLKAIDILDLMLKADLAITAAGQTIYELLATQTPFIPIQIIDNQKNNIKSIQKYYQDQVFFEYDNKLINNVLSVLKKEDEYQYRDKQNRHYRGIIDAHGSRRIVDALILN